MVTVYTTHGSKGDSTPIQRKPISPRPRDTVRIVSSRELCARGSEIRYSKQGKAYLHRYFCKTWSCERCAAYKERQWIAKAKAHDELWAGVMDISSSEAFRKKISRQDGEFSSIRSNGQALFVSTVPIDGFSPVSSHDDLASMSHPWFVPTTEEWGRRKKISHSRGWGHSPADGSTNQEDDNVIKNQENDGDMPQTGHSKMMRLVFVEPPKEVIDVLQGLGSRVRGDVEDLVAPPSEDRGRSAVATFNLSNTAMEFLDLLATGQKDPEERLHLAWPPKVDDDGPHDSVPRSG